MVRKEAALLSTMALAAGLAVSALPMSLLGLVFLDRPWPQGPLWVIPAIIAVTALIACLATMTPTRRALREPPTRVLAAAL